MNKETIQQQLQSQYKAFIQIVHALDETQYSAAPQGKWNAGMQLEHLCKSVAPVKLALSLPVFLTRLLFGKANRPSRSFEVLVEKYQSKLAAGGRASAPYVPGQSRFADRNKWTLKLQGQVDSLVIKVDGFSENQLDELILPHPLLGKLTLREMLYFTIYHAQHHQNSVLQLTQQ